MSSGTTSRFGCFGCFWLGALLAGTVTTAGILYWMQPAWLQPVLFWQTPPFPEEVVFLPEQLLPAPQPEAVPPLESLAELWTDLAASGIYDPATGLSLETLEGSQVVFPPGSVNDAHPITMTPVSSLPSEMSEDTVVPVGPALSLRVADQEHWTFDRPIQVSIPFPDDYLPTDLPPHDLAIAVWEDTAWRVLPTTVDPGTGTLSADVPHASVVATVLILKYLAAGTAMTVGIGINFEPGQAVLKLLQSEVDTTYKTPNFAVHYISRAKSPVAAPPADNLYLAATTSGARQVGQHPLYVTDLGRYFEEGRSWLPDVHHRVSEATLIRWDVFVLPLANEYGVSGLGGPVVIDNDMRFSASDPLPEHLEFEMRRTTVHELIHVAQDDFFNRFQYQRWWIESTAEYLSTYLVTRKMGIEDPKPFYYIGTDFACPALGWDSNSGISHWYSYAKFMESMEAKGLDVPGAIRKISNDGTVTERELSATLRSLPPHLSLADYHTLFAREFYHENLFIGPPRNSEPLTGPSTAGRITTAQGSERFRNLATQVGNARVPNAYGEARIAEPPVVSKLYSFRATGIPRERRAGLVVQVEAPMGAQDVSVIAVGLPSNPPYRGQPLPTQMFRPRPRVTFVAPGIMTGSTATPDEFELYNVIVTHGSFATGDAPIIIRRWLLMAPTWAASGPTNLGGIGVSWHEAELKTAGNGAAFAGYNVYRRQYGTTEFPETPLNAQPVTDEFYLDTTAGSGLFDYTVRVVDIAGNLSEPAPVAPPRDPFVGTWSGRMRLFEGSLAELAARMLEAEIKAAGPVTGNQASAIQGVLATVRAAVGAVDVMLRVGIPMTVEIRRERRGYVMKPLTAFGQPVEDEEELQLDRLGLYTLGKLPTTPQGNAVILSLSGWDEIKRKYRDTFDDPELGTMRFGLAINFKRVEGPGVSTNPA
jgi:hypothetical protein